MTLPKPLYKGVAGSPMTTITEPFVAGTDNTITLADTSILPATVPNRLTIIKSDRSAFATVTYTTIGDEGVLTGVVFEEGSMVTFQAGSTAVRNYTHADNDAVIDDVNYLEANKASTSALSAHTSDTSNPHAVTKAQVGLGNVDNTADISKPISTATQNALDGKVNTITGKGLSTNDYTDADKSKLTGIESGAEVNVQSDWSISDSQDDGYIKNKPSALTPTPHASTHADGGTDEIAIAESQVTGLVDDLAGKQELISSSNKLSADLVDDTSTANKFVTGADKIAWNAKQNALTFDNVPTQGSSNPAKSGGIYDAIATVQTVVAGKVADVKLNGASVVNSSKEAVLVTIDNLTSAGNQNPLSANQGKLLNDRINNLETIGRFLSLWNCATGQPTTQPTSLPYTYKTGDYFIITTVGTTNYKPTGSTYTGQASTTVTTDDVQTGDIWRFDGTNWTLEINHSSASGVVDVTIGGTSIVSAGVAVIPTASSSGAGVITAQDWSTFNGKQNALTFDNLPTANSDNPVKSSGIRTAIDRKVRSGTTAPSVVGDESVGDIYVQYSA